MDTKTKLLETATKVLSERPTATVADIAASLGVSRMTVTPRAFKNRDELVDSTLIYCLEMVTEQLTAAKAKGGERSIDQLLSMMESIVPLYYHNNLLMRFADFKDSQKIKKLTKKLNNTVYEVVKSAQSDGFLKADMEMDWLTVFFFYTAIGVGHVNKIGAIIPRNAGKIAIDSYLGGCGAQYGISR